MRSASLLRRAAAREFYAKKFLGEFKTELRALRFVGRESEYPIVRQVRDPEAHRRMALPLLMMAAGG